ncbi:MAG TPA: hypothetical protein VF144_14825 [Chitinophagaceae bacterium]
MEVHTHTHTPRKKWTHYFWEFLMLFLAVFCGFLAEYQLEHTIEHQREKKYAQSMVDDFAKDTADLIMDIRWWGMQITRADSILAEFDKAEKERDQVILYRCVSFMRRYNAFEYHDRTVEQLKNAGFFRLFRKKYVADTIMEYDARVRRTLLNIERGADEIYYHLNFFQNRLFNTKYFPMAGSFINFDSLHHAQPSVFAVRETPSADIFEYANHLRYYKGNMLLRINMMQNILNFARSAIQLIKNEYNIK